MFKYLLTIITFGIIYSFNSQVINAYAKVTSISGTLVSLSFVNETNDTFEDGEMVMLIQMQDDVIGANTNNDNAFGTISSIGSAGNYEILTIASHTESAGLPNSITFTSVPTKTYSFTANSSVQIVSFRTFGSPNYTTTGNMSALAWNGDIGGVIAFEVPNILYLNHSITASNAGFRGGARSNNYYDNTTNCYNSPFRTSSTNDGFKGEGIYKNTNANYTNSRAKIANGGGGGNQINAGGGGGANFGSGGTGGYGWNGGSGCTAASGGHGFGGQSLASYLTSGRIFMGGGGGGGQMNNTAGSNGGNGGGIVFIRAIEIVTPTTCGTPISITANGQTVVNSGNDGSGGGGAAGTIIIDAQIFTTNSTCPLNINANGGNGGTVNSSTHGAGGAGGQGAIIFPTNTPSTNVNTSTLNGSAGCNNNSVPCNSVAGTSAEPANSGVNIPSTLPVTFFSFDVELLDRNVLVKWTTASELNSDLFYIEKSIDGINFEKVGQVKAAGNSQQLLNYEFIDINAFQNNEFYYYRVKESDLDGSMYYTSLKYIKIDALSSENILVFPNPMNEMVNVYIPEFKINDNAMIQIYDGMQRLVKQELATNSTTSVNVTDLNKGIYFISVIANEKVIHTAKIIK